uniref:Uncharacterized protein n=1 Tax=Arundo donax TaxID=35708 RepID=A0A0A9D1U0_ARUDO
MAMAAATVAVAPAGTLRTGRRRTRGVGGRVQDVWAMQEQLGLFMKKYLRVLLLAIIT